MQRKKRIGFSIRTLNNLIKRDVENSKVYRDEKPSGLHGWAIGYFYEHRNEDVFQRDFEEHFSIRRSTASNMLRLMEENGLIVRERVENDARLKRIVLTERAVTLHEKIMQDIEKREERLKKGLSEEELNTFFAVLDKIQANLEADYD